MELGIEENCVPAPALTDQLQPLLSASGSLPCLCSFCQPNLRRVSLASVSAKNNRKLSSSLFPSGVVSV